MEHKRGKIGVWGLLVIGFFWVHGGIYGNEAMLMAAPPAYVFVMLGIVPFYAYTYSTSRGLRTVRTGYAYQPPAWCAYRRRRAACPVLYVLRTPTSLGRAGRTACRGTTGPVRVLAADRAHRRRALDGLP